MFQKAAFLSILLIALCATSLYPQDFFEPEAEEAAWFYSSGKKISAAAIYSPAQKDGGAAFWMHLPKYNYSSYFEFRGAYLQDAILETEHKLKLQNRQIRTNMVRLVASTGIGSTIYRNFLWYAKLGFCYHNYLIDKNEFRNKADFYNENEYRNMPETSFKLNWGAGASVMLWNRLHLQLGADFETFGIYGGAGFAF
jgi:hypothetical protein